METKRFLDAARGIADWYVRNQFHNGQSPSDGLFHFHVLKDTCETAPAFEWNVAFGIMGMLSAAKVFDDEKYLDSADRMAKYLRTLQIFDPFLKNAYGAIRETTPQTTWCYVRDALSGAWGFLEYYRATGKEEFLERAVLWAEWCLKYGFDDSGWPLWGVVFEDIPKGQQCPKMCDMQGCFHGGSMNFFYQLAKTTGDKKWIGPFFEHMADYFCTNIQQEDGYFRTLDRKTGKVPPEDPLLALHRGNDDLGTLGLLCAYRAIPKQMYLDTITKFLTAVFNRQEADGNFEQNCSAIPVILNVLHESADVLNFTPPSGSTDRALSALLKRQFGPEKGPLFEGGLDETKEGHVCIRSMGYALIYLLKKYGRDDRFLTA